MKHRILIPLAAAMLGLIVVSSASAFECYNASRSARGNEAAAKAPALASVEEILADPDVVGLCPAGIAHVLAGMEAAGYETDSLINWRTVMAQGLAHYGKGADLLLHNGKGIDHLGDEFFQTVDPLIGEGFGICAGG